MSQDTRDSAVALSQVVKTYGSVRALDGLTLDAPRGAVTAILGRNGAGKTTAIEIAEGYRSIDSGSVRVLGLDPGDRSLRSRVGVMLQTGGSYQAARVRELLDLFASFYASPLDPAALLDRLDLTSSSRTLVKRLSGGQAQRLSLALAIVGRPELVFLDEPSAGLDVEARHASWQLIRDLRDAGVSVILTTHYLEEAEDLADWIVMVAEGRAVAAGTPADFTAQTAPRVRFSTTHELSGLRLGRGLRLVRTGRNTYAVDGASTPAALTRVATALDKAGIAVSELGLERATLEDAFLAITTKAQA